LIGSSSHKVPLEGVLDVEETTTWSGRWLWSISGWLNAWYGGPLGIQRGGLEER
jgi:hypothetical protein